MVGEGGARIRITSIHTAIETEFRVEVDHHNHGKVGYETDTWDLSFVEFTAKIFVTKLTETNSYSPT